MRALFQSDIDLVIRRSRKIESLLQRGFGASGRGLHEKVSSVEGQLPNDLVRRLRFIATIRNKTVHESDFRIDDRAGFLDACKRAEKDLKSIGRGTAGRIVRWAILLIILLAAIVLVRQFWR